MLDVGASIENIEYSLDKRTEAEFHRQGLLTALEKARHRAELVTEGEEDEIDSLHSISVNTEHSQILYNNDKFGTKMKPSKWTSPDVDPIDAIEKSEDIRIDENGVVTDSDIFSFNNRKNRVTIEMDAEFSICKIES